MTVYSYSASVPRHIKAVLDQPATVQQCILIVAASSRAAAAEAITATGVDCTPYLLKTYGSETGNTADVAMATAAPATVWASPLNKRGGQYVQVLPRAEHFAMVTAGRYEDVAGRPDVANCRECAQASPRRSATNHYSIYSRDDIETHNLWHEGDDIDRAAATRYAERGSELAGHRPELQVVTEPAERYEVRPLDVYGVARWIVWDRLENRPHPGDVTGGLLFPSEANATYAASHLNAKPENRFPWPPAGT